MREMLKEADLYDQIAKGYRMSLEALMNNGFSREEAMSILSHQGSSIKLV